MSASRTGIAVGVALSILASALAAQDSWPMYQGDTSHSGASRIAIKPGTLNHLWTAQVASSGLSPVTVAAGKVFASGFDKKVRALDAATGSELWSVEFTRAFSVNPPSYAYGNVYVQTGNHSSDTWLRCYDADTGAIVFRSPHQAQWERYQAPTVRDGKVFINGGYYGGMYSFDALSGAEDWFTSLPQRDNWTPAVDGEYAYAYVQKYLYALDRTTGQEAFKIEDYNGGTSSAITPLLGEHDDAFIIDGGRLLRFDLFNRTVSYDVAGGFQSRPSVAGDVLYAINGGALDVRDSRTGALLWSWTSPSGALSSNLVVTSDHVFVGNNSEVFMIDLATRQDIWSYPAGGELAVGEGRLFIARTNGELVAIGFTELPVPASIEPTRIKYGGNSPQVTIRGTGFSKASGTAVQFGSTPATAVTVVDNYTITCVAPALGPGVVDVTVLNSNGQKSIADGFVFTPATETDGNQRLGGDIIVTYYCDPGDQLYGMVGALPLASVAIPPYLGTLEALPHYPLLFVPASPFQEFSFRLPIPVDPGLQNQTFVFQALIGPDLTGARQFEGAFTNGAQVLIR